MDLSIILNAAKLFHIHGALLIALCAHESAGFTKNYTPMDHGSPSFGACQLKFSTAKMLNFHGKPTDLMDPKINLKYAASYLRFQQNRYGNDWVKITAAYNSGTYNPSNKVPGCPRNLKYIRSVQKRLPDNLKYRLDCGNTEIAEEK
jgi:soluble lytic murein transglycosylase-like protein